MDKTVEHLAQLNREIQESSDAFFEIPEKLQSMRNHIQQIIGDDEAVALHYTTTVIKWLKKAEERLEYACVSGNHKRIDDECFLVKRVAVYAVGSILADRQLFV